MSRLKLFPLAKPLQNPRDPYERFLRLFTHYEAPVRSFVRTMMPRPDHCDEIMQNVSIVAWRKMGDFESNNDEDFVRWLYSIARYEVLKYRRTLARDRLVLDEDVVALLADEALEEITLRTRQRQALEICLQKLDRRHRDFVLQVYGTGQSIRMLAEQLEKTPDSLYQLLRRIRGKLMACIEHTLRLDSNA